MEEHTNHHNAEHKAYADTNQSPHLAHVHAPDSLLPNVLAHLEQASGHFSDESSVEGYLAALNDPAWQVRTAAIQGLGTLGGYVLMEPLLVAMSDEDASVRTAAIHVLGNQGERAPLGPLLAALHDPDWLVREAAAMMLGTLGKRVPVEPLVAAVHDENAFVCRAAALALVQAHFASAAIPASQTSMSLQEQKERNSSRVSTRFHAALTPLVTLSQLLFASRRQRASEERHPDIASAQREDGASMRKPISTRHKRSLRLIQGALAVLLMLVSLLFAWLPRLQHPHPFASGHQAPIAYGRAALYTYQGGQGVEGSPVWPSESKYLAVLSSYGYSVQVWDLATGNVIQNALEPAPYVGPGTVSAWSWSPDGRYLAVTGENASSHVAAVQVWDAVTGRNTLTVRSHALYVAWSSDGRRIAFSDDDGTVQIWDPLSGQKLLSFAGYAGFGHRLSWSDDGKLLLLSSPDGMFQLWNAVTGRNISTFHGEATALVALSPDGRRLITLDEVGTLHRQTWDTNEDLRTLHIWDTFSGRELLTYQSPPGGVSFLKWSPEGRRILTANNSEIQVLDTTTGQTILSFPNPALDSAQQSSEGRQILTANNSEIQVWNAVTGQTILSFPNPASSSEWQVSPDGRSIAFGGWNNGVQVWDTVTGRKVASYQGHTAQVQILAWSSDNQRIAFASLDGTVYVWNMLTGRTIQTYHGLAQVVSLTWSPDDKFIATTSEDNTVHVLQAT